MSKKEDQGGLTPTLWEETTINYTIAFRRLKFFFIYFKNTESNINESNVFRTAHPPLKIKVNFRATTILTIVKLYLSLYL